MNKTSAKELKNQISNFTLDAANRNSLVVDGVSPHSSMNSLVQSYGLDLNDQHHIMAIPLHSTIEPNAGYHHTRNAARDASHDALSVTSNSEFGETPISATAVASFLAARGDLQDNINNFGVSVPTIYSSQVLTDYVSNEYSNSPSSRFGTLPKYCEYNEVFGNGSNHWDIPKYPGSVVSFGKAPTRTDLQSNASGDLDATGWISSNGARFGNELSLTLGTSHPSVISGMYIQDKYPDMTTSVVAHNFLNETRFASEHTSCNSEELSPRFGSYGGTPRFSKAVLESRYMCVIQDILGQIANHAFENLDQTSSLAATSISTNTPFSPSWPERETFLMDTQIGSRHEVQMDPALQRRTFEINKAKLLTLLEMVDDCYNQCMDELHTVISAFHEVTKLNPQIHARFALQTISSLYKNLREKISNYFIAMEAHFNPVCDRDSESSFETSLIPKQWALEQLKKKDNRLWRPQRGLPERSVSVLRGWMFQNFLHPYPKDSEKHLLAVKSGLTRSQVSNWFINARVRLWKPLIEEMYAEMNRRMLCQNENTEYNYRSTNNPREI